MKIEPSKLNKTEAVGDNHVGTSTDTPLRTDAFVLSQEEKIERITENFAEIMHTLGLDLKDDSLSGTPLRVAKMYVQEIFGGLLPENEPEVSLFENVYNYKDMLVEKNIEMYSTCEHHFVPIVGVAHVAYFSANNKVIGLSKINRIVQHFAKRPQVQERLTVQIVKKLQEVLQTEDVACVIDAKHLCVSSRGIKDTKSTTITGVYKGKFNDPAVKEEFLRHVSLDMKIDF
jgi:GTP cyclohydrolase IA